MKRAIATFTTEEGSHQEYIFETDKDVVLQSNGEAFTLWEKREDEESQNGYGYPFAFVMKHHLLYLLVEEDKEEEKSTSSLPQI